MAVVSDLAWEDPVLCRCAVVDLAILHRAQAGRDKKISENMSRKKKEAGTDPAKAKELMSRFGMVRVWRCPNTGRWFTDDSLAREYEQKNNITLIKYGKN